MRRLLLGLALCLLWNLSARAEVPADQIFEEKSVRITWDAAGKQSMRVRTVRRLLTDYAVRRLSDPRIRYDASLQELTIHEHRVRTPDGEVVIAPDYARNESQADGIGKTTDFASVVELVATQVGAQRGAVLILDYELVDREPFRPALDLALPLTEVDPVERLLVEVYVPDESPLHWAISQDAGNFEVIEAPVLGGTRSMNIRASDLPGTPQAADGRFTGPRLLASTWSDWDAALRYLEERVREAWEARTTCDLARALAAAEPRRGNLAALHLARTGLRIIKGEIPGRAFQPRHVCRTWDSGYATPVEAVLVLAALAGDTPRAGLMLHTGAVALSNEVPGLGQWTETRAWLGGGTVAARMSWVPARDTVQDVSPLLAPGAGFYRIALDAPAADRARRPGILERLRAVEQPCWSLDEERTYRAAPDGGRALTLHVRLAGRLDVWVELAAADDLEAALTRRVTGLLPGATVKTLGLTRLGPGELAFTAELVADAASEAPIPLGTLFRAPGALAALVGVQDRSLPVALPLCAQVTQTIKTEGLALSGLVPRETGPQASSPRHPVARSRWASSHAFVRTLRGAQALVPPEDWPGVRGELGAWLQDQGRLLLLLPVQEAATE